MFVARSFIICCSACCGSVLLFSPPIKVLKMYLEGICERDCTLLSEYCRFSRQSSNAVDPYCLNKSLGSFYNMRIKNTYCFQESPFSNKFFYSLSSWVLLSSNIGEV